MAKQLESGDGGNTMLESEGSRLSSCKTWIDEPVLMMSTPSIAVLVITNPINANLISQDDREQNLSDGVKGYCEIEEYFKHATATGRTVSSQGNRKQAMTSLWTISMGDMANIDECRFA
jgi:hypothetical protein